MALTEIQGTAKAAKNMSHRRFKRFTEDIKMVFNSDMFNKDNNKLIKDIKKVIRETWSDMRKSWHI